MRNKHSWTLFVKTGPACNAGCPSCPSGRKAKGDIEALPMMKPEMFERILDTILAQARITSCLLYYYNEPTLNPHMPDLVRVAKKKGLVTLISTNGSYPENLKRCMAEGVDNLIFSVSGWTQKVHERSHNHTNIELIKANMEETSRNLKPGQFVRVGWHDYWYNKEEQPMMREFAERLGFKFTPYQTSLLPLDLPVQIFEQMDKGLPVEEHVGEKDLATKMKDAAKMCKDRRHFTCAYQHRMVAIDGNGMLYSCSAKIGKDNMRTSVFETDLEQFNKDRFKDPVCIRCKELGAHVYGTQRYNMSLSFKAELHRRAEDTWRALGLGAAFPNLTKTLIKTFYERPGKKAITK
jgi:pyruvate-formate lyase-activating enzyme